ncbi:MAG: uracil-DNA glycosylase [Bacilli bacterium]|nr:uracil-DNA glycosylase [Bacilli bacterium]
MHIGNDWDIVLKDIFESNSFRELILKVNDEYNKNTCFPIKQEVFNAIKLTPYNKVKVVIVGQDPYHGVGEAHGLSFSVLCEKLPPSLQNIYKELYDDLGIIPSKSGNLTCWANEGVLLLNSVLTVRKDCPASHKNLGWQDFTDEIIKRIEKKDEVVVYILWGNFARSKKSLITNPKHFVIESTHPSPFSARNGFFGSKPFSKCNKILIENGSSAINWEVK